MALASLPLAGVFAQTQAGDLGERLADAFQAVFRAGVQAAIVIGSDLPTLEADDLARATAATRPGQLTVGPARDGGYYLLGLDRRDFEPHLFSGIRWSTETVLAQTLERVAAASLAVVKLREQADWDEQGDVDPQQVSPAFRCTRAALADRFGDGRALRC